MGGSGRGFIMIPHKHQQLTSSDYSFLPCEVHDSVVVVYLIDTHFWINHSHIKNLRLGARWNGGTNDRRSTYVMVGM